MKSARSFSAKTVDMAIIVLNVLKGEYKMLKGSFEKACLSSFFSCFKND